MSYDSDDRKEAADRVERYYEIMGYDPPPNYSDEYQERFYGELDKIQRGE